MLCRNSVPRWVRFMSFCIIASYELALVRSLLLT
jgi:hypothetical protein